MVQYTLYLLSTSQPDSQPVSYNLNISENEENNPESIFNSKLREKMRSQLQQQTACAINNANLEKIIKTWLEDIREGYRTTSITLDLPALEFEEIHQIQDSGDRRIPDLFPPNFSQIEPQGGALPPLDFT
ncbi:hypothetical protein NIES46_03790 [Arthrospira platensis NIES-46]|jgi:hypothetical protein|uniref:Uncharacterized protein n=1 Tax=Limnospira platensis NIES-46 TaxID=1236695 RepID=A0A5M3T383_LIMPL|nr:hypothetical protein [Arthrospira platensis]GCE92340.1 hypothetical protein NIES46_03790 [Arthrospira platensis NIES-46]